MLALLGQGEWAAAIASSVAKQTASAGFRYEAGEARSIQYSIREQDGRMQLKPLWNMGCQSLSDQLDLMMLQSTSVPLDNLHRIWPNGCMASHRACTRTGSRMATSTTIKHRSRHWEKEREVLEDLIDVSGLA